MRYFSITYELAHSLRNHERLIQRLNDLGAIGILGSTWLLRAPLSAAEIRDDLAARIDPDDRLFIAQITAWAYQRLINGEAVKTIVA